MPERRWRVTVRSGRGLFLIEVDDGHGFRPATTPEVDAALRQRELFGAADYARRRSRPRRRRRRDDALTAAGSCSGKMKYWCEHPWRGRFDNARGEVCAKCGRSTGEPYIDTDTAIDRFRNGKSIFTPPRELQAAISNALRATGKLDDFEVAALVHAGVMKKVHLRHPSYREQAACGQPYPTLLTDDRDRVTCGRCSHAGRASASKVESD